MADEIKLTAPLSKDEARSLRTGDRVLLSGTFYAARDSAHKSMVEDLEAGNDLPFDLQGAVIYYMGPTPAPPGKPIGAAGPTTSGRMDPFTPLMLKAGVAATVGKGQRSPEVVEAMKEHDAAYLAVIGGAGALLSQSIDSCEVAGYEDMGPDAVLKLEVRDMPMVVINDSLGGDLYAEGRAKYASR